MPTTYLAIEQSCCFFPQFYNLFFENKFNSIRRCTYVVVDIFDINLNIISMEKILKTFVFLIDSFYLVHTKNSQRQNPSNDKSIFFDENRIVNQFLFEVLLEVKCLTFLSNQSIEERGKSCMHSALELEKNMQFAYIIIFLLGNIYIFKLQSNQCNQILHNFSIYRAPWEMSSACSNSTPAALLKCLRFSVCLHLRKQFAIKSNLYLIQLCSFFFLFLNKMKNIYRNRRKIRVLEQGLLFYGALSK